MKSYFKNYEEMVLDSVREREERKRKIVEQYNESLREYNLLKKESLFRRFVETLHSNFRKPEEPDLSEFDEKLNFLYAQVGQRFAVRYSDIVGAIAELNVLTDVTYTPTVPITETSRGLKTNKYCSEMKNIDNLWTVVEYVGDGLYKDLLTNMFFSTPILSEKIGDTVTQSTEQRNRKLKSKLLQYPLCIDSKEITRKEFFYSRKSYEGFSNEKTVIDGLFPMLYFLTPDVQKQILDESVPRKEEIKSMLLAVSDKERKYIEEYYEKLNIGKIDEYYSDAMEVARVEREKEEERRRKEEKMAREEAARREAEEIKKREAEEALKKAIIQERIDREIMAEFDEFFGEAKEDITVNPKLCKRRK